MNTYIVEVKSSSYRLFLKEMEEQYGSDVSITITPFAQTVLSNFEQADPPGDDDTPIDTRLTAFVKFSNKDMEMFYKLSHGVFRVYDEEN